jgi:hypothetical protein
MAVAHVAPLVIQHSRRRRIWPYALVAILAVLAVGVLAWFVTHRSSAGVRPQVEAHSAATTASSPPPFLPADPAGSAPVEGAPPVAPSQSTPLEPHAPAPSAHPARQRLQKAPAAVAPSVVRNAHGKS